MTKCIEVRGCALQYKYFSNVIQSNRKQNLCDILVFVSFFLKENFSH